MADPYARVIIAHTSEHVRSALEAASEAQQPLALQSAPSALHYAGSLYLLTMFAQEKAAFPDVTAHFILDCGDAGAQTITAMQSGHTHVRSNTDDALRAKLSDIAKQLSVVFITSPYQFLDLAHRHDAKTECKKWLVALE